MALTCQQCGVELPDDPIGEAEVNRLREVVAHAHNSPMRAGTVTDYYCDPECAVKAFTDD